jgi:hypothetical protein
MPQPLAAAFLLQLQKEKGGNREDFLLCFLPNVKTALLYR